MWAITQAIDPPPGTWYYLPRNVRWKTGFSCDRAHALTACLETSERASQTVSFLFSFLQRLRTSNRSPGPFTDQSRTSWRTLTVSEPPCLQGPCGRRFPLKNRKKLCHRVMRLATVQGRQEWKNGSSLAVENRALIGTVKASTMHFSCTSSDPCYGLVGSAFFSWSGRIERPVSIYESFPRLLQCHQYHYSPVWPCLGPTSSAGWLVG